MSYGSGDLPKNNGDFSGFNSSGNSSYQNYWGGVLPTSFLRLDEVITSNIEKISYSIQEIKRLIKLLGTEQDSDDFRDHLHHRQQKTNQLCKDTAKHLKDIRALPIPAIPSEQRQIKTKTNVLITNFSDVLNAFQATQREAAAAEKECVAKARVASAVRYGKEAVLTFDSGIQDQQQITQDQRDELRRQEERNAIIREMEAEIMDINKIFKQLGTMVHDQGTIVDTIENNLEDGEENIVEGNVQLLQARASKAKSRKRKCYLLIAAAISAIIALIVLISKV